MLTNYTSRDFVESSQCRHVFSSATHDSNFLWSNSKRLHRQHQLPVGKMPIPATLQRTHFRISSRSPLPKNQLIDFIEVLNSRESNLFFANTVCRFSSNLPKNIRTSPSFNATSTSKYTIYDRVLTLHQLPNAQCTLVNAVKCMPFLSWQL